MTKISSLTELLGAGVDQANDLLAIVDMSETGAARNKKIKITQLLGLVTDIVGLLDFKGSTDCSGNPNYPAASKGDFYLVSVAGKIGGASGIVVEAGDSYFAIADNAGGTQAGVGSSWTVIQGNISYAPVNKAGDTMTGDLIVPDEAYDATNWNGSLEVPTKNAVRDKIESIGTLSDGDKGDITVSGTGSTWTIDSDVVTYGKLQNASAGNVVLARAANTSGDYSEVALAAVQLLGRGATGDVAALSLGTNLSFSGTTLNGTRWDFSPPLVATFSTAVNDGTAATVTDDTDVGLLIDNGTSVTGDKIRGKVAALASSGTTAFTAICKIVPSYVSTGSGNGTGIFLYETGTDKIAMIGQLFGNLVDAYRGTKSAYTAQIGTAFALGQQPCWFKVTWDGSTTYTFYWSLDGKSWVSHGTVAATTAFTTRATHIGFGIQNNVASRNPRMSVPYFSLA